MADVQEGDEFKIPAGRELEVKSIEEDQIICLVDNFLEKIYPYQEFHEKVRQNAIIPLDDYQKIIRDVLLRKKEPPDWVKKHF